MRRWEDRAQKVKYAESAVYIEGRKAEQEMSTIQSGLYASKLAPAFIYSEGSTRRGNSYFTEYLLEWYEDWRRIILSEVPKPVYHIGRWIL